MVNVKTIGNSWIFWVGLFSIVVLGFIVYTTLIKKADSIVTEQRLRKQQIIAKADAGNAVLFFEDIGSSIVILSQFVNTERQDAKSLANIKTFIEQQQSKEIIGGIGITDKNGVYILNYNTEGIDIRGQSTADQDFFIWAKDQGKKGEFFISRPIIGRFGPSKGQVIVTVAAPLHRNDTFIGTLVTSVKLKPFLDRFFGLAKLSGETRVYVFDDQELLLYSNLYPNSVGDNISEVLLDDEELVDGIKNVLVADKEENFITKKQLVSSSRIILGTQRWFVFVASSTEEVDNLIIPLRIKQIAIVLLIAFGIVLFGGIAIKKRGYGDRLR